MNPKAEIFFDAITLLPEDIVEDAQNCRFRKNQTAWKKFGSLAACLALVASLSLLLLPRGCGGSDGAGYNSSGASMNTADSCAPADTPASSDTAPEAVDEPSGAPEEGCGQTEQLQFTATVIKIYEDSILVEEDGALTIVFTDSLELPELMAGDTVCITYNGSIIMSDPAVILGTQSVEKQENDG